MIYYANIQHNVFLYSEESPKGSISCLFLNNIYIIYYHHLGFWNVTFEFDNQTRRHPAESIYQSSVALIPSEWVFMIGCTWMQCVEKGFN